jgi:PleD family two-component response regulator
MRSDLLSRLFALVRARRPAGTDPATGFANRDAMREDAAEFRALRPEGASMLVISFDSAIPKDFAPDLRSLLHSGDKPYRLSGSEIALLMPATRLARAVGVAEHIRMMSEIELRSPVGISIGIATTAACGFDLEALLASADRAAREARARGANRIVVAEPTAWQPQRLAPSLLRV